MNSSIEFIQAMQRSQRLQIVTAVKIGFSEDSLSPIPACTYEISLTGARIPQVPGLEAIDQTFWIHRKKMKARYRVVWIGEAGTGQANQVGVQLMEPDKIIWEDEIRNKLA